jgi:uncharacterized protein YodC (DUF2158 family)
MSGAFKSGDVVRLKSGGPKMTVTNAGTAHMTGEAFVECAWFVGTKAETASFPPAALAAVQPSSPSGSWMDR